MECGICLEEIEQNQEVVNFSCGHSLHRQCSEGMINRICPFCRKEISFPAEIDIKIDNNIFLEKIFKSLEDAENIRKLKLKENMLSSASLQIATVYNFLLIDNLPLRFIPREFEIKSVLYPNMEVFNSIIFKMLFVYVLEEIKEAIKDEDENSCVLEFIEQSLNPPFTEENLMLMVRETSIDLEGIDIAHETVRTGSLDI